MRNFDCLKVKYGPFPFVVSLPVLRVDAWQVTVSTGRRWLWFVWGLQVCIAHVHAQSHRRVVKMRDTLPGLDA